MKSNPHENKEPALKRFYKPDHFLVKSDYNPVSCLWEIFQNFSLEDFRREINHWQNMALSNDHSAYDEGNAREDLIDFIQLLQRLIEAFHIINERQNASRKLRLIKGFSRKMKTVISQINQPILLTNKEKEDPCLAVNLFCKAFEKSYVRIELLDLLGAVTSYEGVKSAYTVNPVMFYQHIHYLTRLAYSMAK
ncbi:hypothetical protein [Compostibacter hankyongensis]|uniref:Uncharacterized protein n=1 Tax=Compostibacter hankyongensis TaxID=1007089 RepID=A0ABP8FDC0_9BACT